MSTRTKTETQETRPTTECPECRRLRAAYNHAMKTVCYGATRIADHAWAEYIRHRGTHEVRWCPDNDGGDGDA